MGTSAKTTRAGRRRYFCFALTLALAASVGAADLRRQPPKDLDGYFPWTPPDSQKQWVVRAQKVREQMRVSLGLWPLPSREPLRTVIHSPVAREGYTVERVFFEAMPGFYVTGSLYRPAAGVGAVGPDGRRAAVLCPHGHWTNGRFTDAGKQTVDTELASDAEIFPTAARSPLQAKCVQLARMGCVVFFYDMIGYADSRQLSMEIGHTFAHRRPEMNAAEGWGFYSPRAEGWNQNIMGLQTWNSIRALDFVAALPDVDPARIGVTGASGGGTQAFILAALDPRPAAVFPAVMVGTAMQGGCTCENACGLRVGTGNVEFAALFAPKPMALTAADDWTREMPTKGFPELQRHWARLGAPDHLALTSRLEFGHNYNRHGRAAMYAWFNRHLSLGLSDEALVEKDFNFLRQEEATVWTAAHPAPSGEEVGPAFEKKLLGAWGGDVAARLAEDPAAVATGWRTLLGRTREETGRRFSLDQAGLAKQEHGDYLELRGVVRNETHGEEVEATFLYPKAWNGEVILWLEGTDTPPAAAVAKVQAGSAVVLSRLFAPEWTKNPRVKNPRQAPAYTYGYNHPLFAQRVHDGLTLIEFCRTNEAFPPQKVRLVAVGPAAPLGAAVALLAGDALASAEVAETAFRFADVEDDESADFLPGALRFGDVPGLRKAAGL